MSFLQRTLNFGKKIKESTHEAHALMKNIMFANVVTVMEVHKKAMSVNQNVIVVPSNTTSQHVTVHFNSRVGVQDFLKFVREKRQELNKKEHNIKRWFGIEESNYFTMMDWLKMYTQEKNIALPLHNEPYSPYAEIKYLNNRKQLEYINYSY